MLEKLDYIFGCCTTRPVFVIGTGRSGTHWLGYSLANHPEVRATIEIQPLFRLSTRMALNPTLEDKIFDRLVNAYRWQLFKSAPKLYLDKTHPNIWFADKLKAAFPDSLFLGIERNPYATVASMMRHKGVSAWHKRWREFPVPNRFLGITREAAENYDNTPLASQCAMRWIAHQHRMKELQVILRDSLFSISYEQFAYDPAATICAMKEFLGLRKPIPVPDVRMDSLNKWKVQLADEEISQIHSVVGFGPDSAAS